MDRLDMPQNLSSFEIFNLINKDAYYLPVTDKESTRVVDTIGV